MNFSKVRNKVTKILNLFNPLDTHITLYDSRIMNESIIIYMDMLSDYCDTYWELQYTYLRCT